MIRPLIHFDSLTAALVSSQGNRRRQYGELRSQESFGAADSDSEGTSAQAGKVIGTAPSSAVSIDGGAVIQGCDTPLAFNW
ncbi:hypothetical protein [Arthrobacter sp. H20]|uniref:hypothetical protein n=1 Tax=Arthrobacter sp. H20 TaxID=1267981 RepID=UPI00047AA263|nr:hypothetical protein [Arthrobacter sp. H20]